jgi:hypothetical protein
MFHLLMMFDGCSNPESPAQSRGECFFAFMELPPQIIAKTRLHLIFSQTGWARVKYPKHKNSQSVPGSIRAICRQSGGCKSSSLHAFM